MRRRANRLMGGGRTVLFDSFTDADGTFPPQHAPDSGHVWVNQVGASDEPIASNRLSGAAVVGGAAILAVGGKRRRRNAEVSFDLIRVGTTQGCSIGAVLSSAVAVNGSTPRFEYELRYRNQATPGWTLLKRGATVLATVNQTLTIDQVYRVRFAKRGSRFLFWLDGALTSNVEDAETKRNAGVGIYVNSAAAQFDLRLDNWRCER